MTGPERPGSSPAGPVRIRTSRSGLLAVVALAVCTLPLASSAPWLAVLWLLPIGVGAWVLRSGVDVDPDGLIVRALLGSRRVRWDDVAGLRAEPSGRLAVVLREGGAIRLPTVRARHLPLLAAGSGGRVPDPAQ
jgi:hypothetical protein